MSKSVSAISKLACCVVFALGGCRESTLVTARRDPDLRGRDDERIQLSCADAEDVAHILWEMLDPRRYAACAIGRDYDPMGIEERSDLVGFDRATNSLILRGLVETRSGLRELIARVDEACCDER